MRGENVADLHAFYELVSDVLNPNISLSFLENCFVSVARTFLKMKTLPNSALFAGLIHDC